MRIAIITMILLALFGCKSGHLGISETTVSENIPVSFSVPSGSKIVLIDPNSGQKKEFVLDSIQDIEFFVNKDSLPKNNIYQLIFIIGSVFLGFLVLLSALEFFKRRST